MNVQPTGQPWARPLAAGALARPERSELESLVRDVMGRGTEIRVPRFIPWLGNRPAKDAAEVARRLEKEHPKLQVSLPGVPVRLPMHSPQDLQELAVFNHLQPASELAHAQVDEPQPASRAGPGAGRGREPVVVGGVVVRKKGSY